jgi:Brp/Blh family beta-carotene 15,15'-monooxygenase
MMRIAELYYQRVFLVAIAILVSVSLLGEHIGDRTALIVLVSGVVLLGLPHGALDPLVARKAFVAAHKHFNLIAFFLAYAGVAMIYGLLWFRFPTFGLISFLIIAAFHFGSDWQPRGVLVTRVAYGITLVTLPAATHPAEVASIYAALGTSHAATIIAVSRICAALALVVAGSAAALRYRECRGDLFEILGIAAGAVLLQPLIFFTCYFTLLHSPRHLLQTARSLDIQSFSSLFIETIPIVGATVVLWLGATFLLPAVPIKQMLLTIVFVGLASLTVPHMILEVFAEAVSGEV